MQFPTNREITGTSVSQISVRVWFGIDKGKIKLEAEFLFGGDDNGLEGIPILLERMKNWQNR